MTPIRAMELIGFFEVASACMFGFYPMLSYRARYRADNNVSYRPDIAFPCPGDFRNVSENDSSLTL